MMSIHSCIMLKLRKGDMGKKVKFDASQLIVGEWGSEKCDEKSQEITLENEYIGVYCHFDGYLEGVGHVLKSDFNSYEKILNLIVGGDLSYVKHDSIMHYANRSIEEWEWISPKQGKTQVDVISKIDCEYVYLFDEERGGWLYKTYTYSRSKEANKRGFKRY